LLAEDRAQQLLFRRQLRLPLRGDLADQDVARLDLRADEGDACLIELARAASPTFGMSAVISSGPSLVSRATQVSSSMWMVVKRSSWTTRSEMRIESSKL